MNDPDTDWPFRSRTTHFELKHSVYNVELSPNHIFLVRDDACQTFVIVGVTILFVTTLFPSLRSPLASETLVLYRAL